MLDQFSCFSLLGVSLLSPLFFVPISFFVLKNVDLFCMSKEGQKEQKEQKHEKTKKEKMKPTQTRPDQIRPDQTRPSETRLD